MECFPKQKMSVMLVDNFNIKYTKWQWTIISGYYHGVTLILRQWKGAKSLGSGSPTRGQHF